METLIALLIIVAVLAVLFWLIDQITFGPAILKSILKLIVVLAGVIKIWPML